MTDWILKKLDHLKTPQKTIALWDGDVNSLKLVDDVRWMLNECHNRFLFKELKI